MYAGLSAGTEKIPIGERKKKQIYDIQKKCTIYNRDKPHLVSINAWKQNYPLQYRKHAIDILKQITSHSFLRRTRRKTKLTRIYHLVCLYVFIF